MRVAESRVVLVGRPVHVAVGMGMPANAPLRELLMVARFIFDEQHVGLRQVATYVKSATQS